MNQGIKYDYLIVGAGLFGATFAHLAGRAGKKCLVIDRRPVAGGNVYCETIENIPVHKYGAHIFHTSNKTVWDFVNSFVPFNRYTNCPVAVNNGRLFNLPFNMNTFYQMWGVTTPEDAQNKINQQRQAALDALCGAEPHNLEEQALTLVGRDIYETLIKGYTEKQWGRKCCELPAFIIKRLPLRLVFDNNYFNDPYQGIPATDDGYNTLIQRLLEKSDVTLGVDFKSKSLSQWLELCRHIVYTGPIDALFDYKYGNLSYRSVRFDTKVCDTPNFQGNAVVNYTDGEVPFTRIIEHKHFNTFGADVYKNPKTVVSYEYPMEWTSEMEPFYPVNDESNSALYNQYKQDAEKLDYISIAGRLGQYRYFDMDKTIEEAMALADRLLK